MYLTSELVQQYGAKKIEHDTKDKTYCSNEHCSAFIVVDDPTDEQVCCSKCEEVTCTMCKGVAHTGDCPADSKLQMVLALADELHWQRCTGCRAVVELSTGCNHIT
jgi:IBR domain, a half RING-finger domain